MTPTTNKLIRLDDVSSIMNTYSGYTHIGMAMWMIAELPTYPEPIKGSNHELLQKYIDSSYSSINLTQYFEILKEIQSRLIEPMEYEIGKEYEFSNDRMNYSREIFSWYHMEYDIVYRYIRPIKTQLEITSAISFLEATGEYLITKK